MGKKADARRSRRKAKLTMFGLVLILIFLIGAVIVGAVQETYFADNDTPQSEQQQSQESELPLLHPAALHTDAPQSEKPQSEEAEPEADEEEHSDRAEWDRAAERLQEQVDEVVGLLARADELGGYVLDREGADETVAAAQQLLAVEPGDNWTTRDYQASIREMNRARFDVRAAQVNASSAVYLAEREL